LVLSVRVASGVGGNKAHDQVVPDVMTVASEIVVCRHLERIVEVAVCIERTGRPAFHLKTDLLAAQVPFGPGLKTPRSVR
jgi:hypothetical protein